MYRTYSKVETMDTIINHRNTITMIISNNHKIVIYRHLHHNLHHHHHSVHQAHMVNIPTARDLLPHHHHVSYCLLIFIALKFIEVEIYFLNVKYLIVKNHVHPHILLIESNWKLLIWLLFYSSSTTPTSSTPTT